MSYTIISTSPSDNNIRIAVNTETSELCYTVDGGVTYSSLVALDSTYTATHTGLQIDSGVAIALSLVNPTLLNTLYVSNGAVYIADSELATKNYVDGLTYLPVASGNSAGIVQNGPQITFSSGIPSLVTTGVSAYWSNILDKQSATSTVAGVVRFATDAEVSGGSTGVAVTPAQLANNVVNYVNTIAGTVTISGESGIVITNSATNHTIGISTSGLVQAAPSDGQTYVQKNGNWAPFSIDGTVIEYHFTTIANTGSAVTFTLQDFGNPPSPPEFDLIDSDGYNISYESRFTYRWSGSSYTISCSGGWPAGSWKLKARGIEGPPYTLGQITSYTAASAYRLGDMVTYSGQVYQAYNYAAASVFPTNSDVWRNVVNSGAVGPANSLSINTVETLDPSSSAYVHISGTSPNQTLDFGIPRGSSGATPVVSASATTLDPGSSATATVTSTTASNVMITFGIPRGSDGSAVIDSTSVVNIVSEAGYTTSAAVSSIIGDYNFVQLDVNGAIVLSNGTANDVVVYPDGQTSSSISLTGLAAEISGVSTALAGI